ncbi:glutathione-disulfide reductase [Methylovirgula sp. 4M-Z18]|uniref:glutathione-disulfide reductase n=1 Tax=Methylovirgula sp. 4M-Z18 TaxID=2293567 RepID=UPI000E2E787A|nr:glutathione-disulfide reductase [Methylovirgula sp. 4M-Z18]RFB80170.1 glutathione-disulfide reductase [Methylovirgula sp. 4M-Z18]
MTPFDTDLFVIGAGSGGVRAARIAAGYGAKVKIAEEFRVGGTCVIRGCVPKKLYVYASRFADEFAEAAGYGWEIPEKPVFHWRSLVEAKEKEITRLSGIYRANLEKAGVELIEKRAVVEDCHTVRLHDGRKLRAKHILIATGASPVMEPHVPGIEHAISSNQIFDLKHFPHRLLIVGGGYIAVEFASIFARLGSAVSLCFRSDNVLRGFDQDMRKGVSEALTHAGVAVSPGTLPTRIARHAGGHLEVTLSDGRHVIADQVLIATGRKPHTANLGLERAGVELDASGAVKVDAVSQSNIPSIHAVGDVTNRINLTPVAIREGHAYADTVFGGKKIAVDHHNVPSAVFTTPELGTVGLTEEQARRTHDVVDIYKTSFRPMRATLSGAQEKTIMKIVVDGETDKVLGVHILGHDAGEMAQVLGIAVKMGATKADFDATMALHPTASEELVTMRTRTERHERLRAAE